MRRPAELLVSAACLAAAVSASAQTTVYINEIHYDNTGTDTGEAVEIAGPAGTSLGGWRIIRYNSNDGRAYDQPPADPPEAETLSGTIPELACGWGVVVVAYQSNGLQNGTPDGDGIALVDRSNQVIQLLSYQGTFTAADGPAAGMVSTNIGVAESSDTPVGHSLQLGGEGRSYEDFNWRSAAPQTFGGINREQTLSGCTSRGSEIWEIQGHGLSSPLLGQRVTTTGNTVTAVAGDGFFMQTPAARTDADPETSDGIFVYTGAAPAVAAGNQVDVTGDVVEYYDLTELGSSQVTIAGTSSGLPAPVQLDALTPSPAQPRPAVEMERLEGMLVHIAAGVVSGASDSYGDACIVAGPVRAFREAGIAYPGLAGLPVWDGNPERFELDPDALGLPDLVLAAGTRLTATGVIAEAWGAYQLWPTRLEVETPELPRPVRARRPDEWTIATQNLQWLFDDIDDGNGEVVVASAEYSARRASLALHIREVLGAPDLLAVQEVESEQVLSDLADTIAAADPELHYTPLLIEGNDINGIDVGFLVRDTVEVIATTQIAADTQISTGGGYWLYDRPPLVLEAALLSSGMTVTVINLHLRSLIGIESNDDGEWVRRKRFEQAEWLAGWLQQRQSDDPVEHLVVIGDLNAFHFSDGYVDVLGQITGRPDPAGAMLTGTVKVDPPLTNQVLVLPPEERYSWVEDCNAEAIDHVLTSQNLTGLVTGIAYTRGNADLPADTAPEAGSALRSSDHDGLVLYLSSGLRAWRSCYGCRRLQPAD
jgi:predicted extracellular nuclease